MKESLELFQRLKNKFTNKVFITGSYALKELGIINRSVNDLDIVINDGFLHVINYLEWLLANSEFKFEILNNLDQYGNIQYIKIKMSDGGILDILYLEKIELLNGFISPRIIKQKKLEMIYFYRKTNEVEKIEKHNNDIIKIDEYFN